METKKEAVSLRNRRLFQNVLTSNCPMKCQKNVVRISHDALLDSLLALFDECSKDGLSKDITVSYFVSKYKTLVSEVRSLRASINDFDVISVVGKGYFGEVRVAREKHTGDIYAVKIINKAKTLQNASAALFEEERDILSNACSEWLTTLQYAFQDNLNLYLVMEYLSGGDLLSLLEREGGHISVELTRFYLAETVLAIHALHSMGYVHRDIKPDNILLDRCGHIKLTDFGSAARLSSSGRINTALPAGTPDYVAPEVLQALDGSDKKKRVPYGTECDFWSLGVLAYALVFGSSPFSGSRTSETYNKILSHQNGIPYPDSLTVTDSLKDLINNLLRPAESRLDYQRTRKHVFFLEIDFINIRQDVPPHVPVVSSPEDTSNFSRRGWKTSEPILTPRDSPREFSGRQLPFIGFTYSGFSEKTEIKKVEPERAAVDRKSQSIEAVRKENKELLAKLFAAQEQNKDKGENRQLEKVERERLTFQKELAKHRQEAVVLRRVVEQERADRRIMEDKALTLARQTVLSHDKELKTVVAEFQGKIELLNDQLTEAHTKNNELVSKCDRTSGEVASLKVDLDRLKDIENKYMEKLAQVREKRKSVSVFESRLDKIQKEHEERERKCQDKVAAANEASHECLKQLQEVTEKNRRLEEKWKNYGASRDKEVSDLNVRLLVAESELESARLTLTNKSHVEALEEKLKNELAESSRLRSKLVEIETDLSNTNQSFLENEAKGQREHVCALESELKKLSQEKIQLHSILQNTKDRDKENKNKLSEVKQMLSTLETEVKKLEKENADLKKSVSSPESNMLNQLSFEVEAQYKAKIAVLEERIIKLEGQIDRMKESEIKEKQEARSTQSKLWKTEKELSDTKIDVRIANRETKEAEAAVTKLKDELKIAKEKVKMVQVCHEEELSAEKKKNLTLQEDLLAKDKEMQTLLVYQVEVQKLRASEKQLQIDHNTLRQKLSSCEDSLASAQKVIDRLKKENSCLLNEKATLYSTVDSLRVRMNSLELNNSALKEASVMLDEQLVDFETLLDAKAATIQQLSDDNANLVKSVNQLELDLKSTRTALADEKVHRAKTDKQLNKAEDQLASELELVADFRHQLNVTRSKVEELSQKLLETEDQVQQLQLGIDNRDEEIALLNADLNWLKEENSNQLTNLYNLKEENYQLHHDLGELDSYTETLQNRIHELEGVVSELETFHRQREMKDDSTKLQQNKLINFLQAKLAEDKKKRTFADKLFGPKRRDAPPSPQTPAAVSPRQLTTKSTSANQRLKPTTPKKTDSPRTQEAMNQLVNSPASRLQRQMSLPRMHHKIPHRFKSQLLPQSGKCAGCYDNIPRRTRVSVCEHCHVPAHPKCAITAPKTCGLPTAFAKHFAQAVEKPENESCIVSAQGDGLDIQGFVDVMMCGDTNWQRKYMKVSNGELAMFDSIPQNDSVPPLKSLKLRNSEGHVLVSDTVLSSELPSVASTDLRFVIKVVTIPTTTCWPSETLYILIRVPADKPMWVAALQNAVTSEINSAGQTKVSPTVKPSLPVYFTDVEDYGINCVHELTDKISLIGTNKGLFSLKKEVKKNCLVNLSGVTSIQDLAVSQHINQILLVAGEGRRLLSADLRLTTANAGYAACASPSIKTEIVSIECEDPVLLIAISSMINENVYLTVATATKIIFMRWCADTSRFTFLRAYQSAQPSSCVVYYNDSVIVGTDVFRRFSLDDFSSTDVLSHSEMSSDLLRLGSFPMQVLEINKNELLLCFNEFCLFVDKDGRKTRSDLKLPHVPKEFAYSPPYLYVIGMGSLEIVRLAFNVENDDAASISTTATVSDTIRIPLKNPKVLGKRKSGGIFVRNGNEVIAVDAFKMNRDEMGSSSTLHRDGSVGQFSFTSSLVCSLDSDDDKEGNFDDVKQTAL